MQLVDELADALRQQAGNYRIWLTDPTRPLCWCRGYDFEEARCTDEPQCVAARAALARYDQEQADKAAHAIDGHAQTWARIQSNYPELWHEWLRDGLIKFNIWLQTRYPDVWQEYVREDR